MENTILEQLAAASMAAEVAVNAAEIANAKSTQAIAEMFNLRQLAAEANANVEYAHNVCKVYIQQMKAMSMRIQILRATSAIEEMTKLLPEANKLKDDFQKARETLIQACQKAAEATAAYNHAFISANNLLDEASRLTTEANKAIDYANQLDQMATEAL